MARRLQVLVALAATLAGVLSPQATRAQDSSAATGAAILRAQVFVRAQRLVNDGNGAVGRALVDSLLNAIAPRSTDEAEVLFWRATLAENWDQAQRDYLRVMLEHERSPFASASMLRLAQGEMMRGDRDAARRYVERLLAEAPEAMERAEALALRTQLVGATVWSVQVAAFPAGEQAAAFAADLRERGYDARVDGIAPPFRVRFGHFASRDAAAAAMDAYRAKERADAFLTQVPIQ